MKFFRSAAFLIALMAYSAYGQDISLLQTGTFHGEEVSAQSGETWLGLYRRSDGFVLMPSILTVTPAHDRVVDGVGEISGKSVKVSGLGEPVFLIKGEGFSQARAVASIKTSQTPITDGFKFGFEFNEIEYSLRLENESKKEDGERFVSDGSKLVFDGNGMSQLVYEVEDCSFCVWELSWVGDIDGDLKPDLFMNLTDHYNVSNQKLFLSSRAENGKLVKEVAEFVTTGC